MGQYRLGTETTVDLYCTDEFEKCSLSSVVVEFDCRAAPKYKGGRWGRSGTMVGACPGRGSAQERSRWDLKNCGTV